MNRLFFSVVICFLSLSQLAKAQVVDSVKVEKELLDSLYISETQDVKGRDKVLHAEPLYIDLIRDLGARKGEREWNLGFGLTDHSSYTQYEGLVEYEWAPVDRLGLEVEVPFTVHQKDPIINIDPTPSDRINGLKLAAQYSFYVSERNKTSLAIGYIHEFEMGDFPQLRAGGVFQGIQYNPFLVGARRWGDNFHTLIYTGPKIDYRLREKTYHYEYDINTSFHYMIPGTRNFVGVEVNSTSEKRQFATTLRPQLRLGIAENMMIGIVSSVAINRGNERLGTFFRLIYEPRHRKA